MVCISCNIFLTDLEATRRSPETGEFLDMCNACLGTIVDDLPYEVPGLDEVFTDSHHHVEFDEDDE